MAFSPAPGRPARPIDLLLTPFRVLAHHATAGSVLLVVATVAALAWANSPWHASYERVWEAPLAIGVGPWQLELTVREWINDGLMTLFFLVVGLEIERELLVGTLARPRAAALPIAAAVGGMLAPAGLYLLFTAGTPAQHGWGVPMATDIAFALGLLGLLAPGAPPAVRAFLAALAIVDDLGAILVIALFYSGQLDVSALRWAAALVALLVLLNRLGARQPVAYLLVGLPFWYALHASGIHATIAGVVLAFAIPARTRVNSGEFVQELEENLARFRSSANLATDAYTDASQMQAMDEIGIAYRNAQSPSLQVERTLHVWVALLILPLFALANAGVHLGDAGLGVLALPPALGVMAGLVLGKPVGITLAAWLAVRAGLAEKPASVSWLHIVAAGCLGGIGFTMALFIIALAFGHAPLADTGKLAILVASTAAALLGAAMLRLAGGPVIDRAAGAA